MKIFLICQRSYFPTMPEDELHQVREALLLARGNRHGSDNPVIHCKCNIHIPNVYLKYCFMFDNVACKFCLTQLIS